MSYTEGDMITKLLDWMRKIENIIEIKFSIICHKFQCILIYCFIIEFINNWKSISWNELIDIKKQFNFN